TIDFNRHREVFNRTSQLSIRLSRLPTHGIGCKVIWIESQRLGKISQDEHSISLFRSHSSHAFSQPCHRPSQIREIRVRQKVYYCRIVCNGIVPLTQKGVEVCARVEGTCIQWLNLCSGSEVGDRVSQLAKFRTSESTLQQSGVMCLV